jgi:thiamine-monophosphate kinase
MGAEPGEAYVAVGVPADLGEEGCLELIDGLAALAAETGTTLAGGDITRAPALTLAVTVVGHASTPGRLIARGGAQPGDELLLTGEIGGAAAGLLLLERPELAPSVPERTADRLRARQLDPSPRLAAGRSLAATGARAMIDVSDGLGGDATHLASASGVAIRIDAGLLPLAPGVAEIASAAGRDPLELAATGGEDYELLAALPQERLAEAVGEIGAETRLTRIGEVYAGEGVEIRLPDGATVAPAGFDQLG